jgi:hypothetical protein
LSAFHRGSGATYGTCLGSGRDRQQGWGLYRCIGGHRTGEANGGAGRNEEEERRTGTAAGAKHTKGTAEGGGLIRESNE